jgi:hypothetical protein
MKLRNIFYLWALLIAPLHAQSSTLIQPDCFIPFTFTAAGNYPVTATANGPGDNRQKGCAAWTLMYQSTGMTGVSVTLQSGSSVNTTVSFGSFAGTISTGFVNPIVSNTGGSLQAVNGTADISWVRVNVAATGTGTLTGVLYGFRNSSAAVSNKGGSVTSINTGCGISGGPITTTGTLVGTGVCETIPNAAMTGTTVSKLAKLTGAPSKAVISGAGDTGGAIGIVDSGAGTTGSAVIQEAGQHGCVFDGATTAGHYVQISASVAGDCTDAGATYPTSGQVIGIVLSTNGGGGTYTVDMSQWQAFVSSGTLPAGSAGDVQLYGTSSTFKSGVGNIGNFGNFQANQVDSPTAVTTALAGAGAGNVDNGSHDYAVTFVMPRGETDMLFNSATVTVADKTMDGKVQVSAIPLGPAGTTARKLYRTVAYTIAASSTCQALLATIADNTTTTYLDNTADAGLGLCSQPFGVNMTGGTLYDALGFPFVNLTSSAGTLNNTEWTFLSNPANNFGGYQIQDMTMPANGPAQVATIAEAYPGQGGAFFYGYTLPNSSMAIQAYGSQIIGNILGTSALATTDNAAILLGAYRGGAGQLFPLNAGEIMLALGSSHPDGNIPYAFTVVSGGTMDGDGGRFGINIDAPTADLHVVSLKTTDVTEKLQRVAMQSADVMELLDSDGTTVLAAFDSNARQQERVLTFATLGTLTNGKMTFCSDCTVTSGVDNTCAGSGTGAHVEAVNGVKRCWQ